MHDGIYKFTSFVSSFKVVDAVNKNLIKSSQSVVNIVFPEQNFLADDARL